MSYTKLNQERGDADQEPDGGIDQPVQRHVRDVRGRLHRDVRDRKIRLPGRRGPLSPAVRDHHRRLGKGISLRPVPLFSIMGTAAGAYGFEADCDKATFEKVSTETTIGRNKDIKLKVPFIVPGMGSTNVAKQNWQGLAIGAAISGSMLTVGENVCAMDEESEIKNGRVVRSPDMEMRVRSFQELVRRLGRRRRPGQRRGLPGSASRNTPSKSWASRPSNSSGARAPRTSAARSKSRA